MYIVTECAYRDGEKMPINEWPSAFMHEDDAFEDMSERLHLERFVARPNTTCLEYDYALFKTEEIDRVAGEYSFNKGWVRNGSFVYVVEIFDI